MIAAGKEELRKWFQRGTEKEARYMVIVCDRFDFDDDPDFPCYAKDEEEAHEIIRKHEISDAYKVMEVYDLTADMEAQLRKKRAWSI